MWEQGERDGRRDGGREGRVEWSGAGKMTQWTKHLTYKIWGLECGSPEAPPSWMHGMDICTPALLGRGGNQRQHNDP